MGAVHEGDEESSSTASRVSNGCHLTCEDDVAFVASLKACAKQKDLCKGMELHANVLHRGLLTKNKFMGNALVNLYAKCGLLSKAQQVFYELSVPDLVSWTVLITGYCEHGHGEEALYCFEQMKCRGMSPDAVTFSCALKACGSIRMAEKGIEVHAEVVRKRPLGDNCTVGSALVDMYAKCGLLTRAQEVFDVLRVRDVVSWTALISGYSEHGHGKHALDCYDQMKHEGLSPDSLTFALIIKACGSIKATEKGIEVHVELAKRQLLRKDVVLGSALVDMYVKCGALDMAQEVFNELPVRDVVSWTALITGYIENAYDEDALHCFEQMQHEGLSPDAITLACTLKSCASVGAVDKGEAIHALTIKKGQLGKDTSLSSALLDMYSKFGAFARVEQIFDGVPNQDILLWNALIASYNEVGQGKEAMKRFKRMKDDGISPDTVTFACFLKACGSILEGLEIHGEVFRLGLLDFCPVLGNALVDMYAKCGALSKAHEVFEKLSVKDVVSWNILIYGYLEQGHKEEILNCFERMQREGVSPDAVTYIYTLTACGSMRTIEKGKTIHADIFRKGLSTCDTVLGSALLDMYLKCGALHEAQEVFDELWDRDVVLWTALITGFCEHGLGEKALECLERMEGEDLSPDEVTLACILKACGSIGAADKGSEVHVELITKGFLGKDIVLNNALVDMYAKCGALVKAQEVFEELPVRDVVSWNALVTGYAQHGHGENALICFEQMQDDGLSPDMVTFACILKACGSIGAADKGKEIHAEIVRKGLLGVGTVVGNALVDMYTKCGALVKAQQVFYELPIRDVVSWNALIAGYSEHGYGEEALFCFEQMKFGGFFPDAITFTSILKACGNMGAADKGQSYLQSMSPGHGILPTLEHQTSMVDMLARAGYCDKAMEGIKQMPTSKYLPAWFALLGACQKWGDMNLGRSAFEQAVGLDEKCAGAYVCMGSMYATLGSSDGAKETGGIPEFEMFAEPRQYVCQA